MIVMFGLELVQTKLLLTYLWHLEMAKSNDNILQIHSYEDTQTANVLDRN